MPEVMFSYTVAASLPDFLDHKVPKQG